MSESPTAAVSTHQRSLPEPSRFVVMSGYHDYRSKRRANLHFIADELARRGDVFFFSERYSLLTKLVEDPRHDLRRRSNRLERIDRIGCYLWWTPIHACRLPRIVAPLERLLFSAFAGRLPRIAQDAIAEADVIFVESGIAIIHLPLLRKLAPQAQIIYLASDALDAINQAESVKMALRRHASIINSARLPSPLLRADVPPQIPCYFIPHGIEKQRFDAIGPSPYRTATRNAVSVGSMLFDPEFFRIAAPLFPEVTFHIIGSGHKELGPTNVIYHPEMAFEATLPFIKHADFAIAPYGDGVATYLTDTSMKLMQYSYLGVPAVCPEVVAKGRPGRLGYERGSATSISDAIRRALAHPKGFTARIALGWEDVVERLLHPRSIDAVNL